MCNFRSFATREAYGLELTQGAMGGPWKFSCNHCSLSPERPATHWKTVAQLDWSDVYKDSPNKDGLLSVYHDLERMYKEIRQHVKDHVAAGHYVHPSIDVILSLYFSSDYESNVEGPMRRLGIKW